MSSSTSRTKHKGGLLTGKAVYQVDNQSRLFCSYCGKDFLVTCMGTHMNTQCREAMMAMGKNPAAIEKRRKEVRNAKNKENSKVYENRVKINKKIWERAYKKLQPEKEFDANFIKVQSWNPFHLEESEVKKDEEMQVLFDKLKEQNWKQNANLVIKFFQGYQTRNQMQNWKQMKSLTRKLLGPKLQRVLHPDKMTE